MKKFLFIMMITTTAFYSCQQKQGKDIPQVGSFDSTAIASDTNMQQTMESSYEYSKTLVASPKLVYDVLAFGGPPSAGEYAIIRRGADNKPDTVVRGKRHGIFKDAFITRTDKYNRREIYIAEYTADKSAYGNIIGWMFDKDGKATELNFEHGCRDKKDVYRGGDSIYLSNAFEGIDDIYITFPAYRKTDVTGKPTAGKIKIMYLGEGGQLSPGIVDIADSTQKITGIKPNDIK